MATPNFLTGKIAAAKRLDLMVAEIPVKWLSHQKFAAFLDFRKQFEYELATKSLLELEEVADEKFPREFWLHALELSRDFRNVEFFDLCRRKVEE